jgi:hypothetical protein
MLVTPEPEVKSLNYSEVKFQDRELAQWGATLPLGIFLNGERLREYTLKPYLGRHDVLLGRLEDDNRDVPNRLTKIYCHFLPEIVESIDGWPITEIASRMGTTPNRMFRELYTADFLSLILNVRCKGIGNEVAISAVCPFCGHKINHKTSGDIWHHDLSSVIIRGFDYLAGPPLFKVPFNRLYADETIDCFYWQPPKFTEVSLDKDCDPIFSRICVAPGGVLTPITESACDRLHYTDFNKLNYSLENSWFGPEQTIPMECPSCTSEWISPLHSQWEEFYCSLLSPPRPNNKPKSVEEYFNELDFFFRTGEQAPRINVFDITPASREFWMKKLSEMYKKQKEEMDRSAAKSRNKH